MIYFIYDILLFLASLIYLPIYALRGKVHREILTRLGFFKKGYFDTIRGAEVVWIHAVSVGEARAAESLVQLVRQFWPQKRIVLSVVTPTGHAILKKIATDEEIVFYAPLDISWVVKRFLSLIQPRLLIIMETELWPNLIRLSKKQGVCVVVANGRISDRSYRRYQRFGGFFKSILGLVDLLCMQTEESAKRIVDLGALPNKVKMTGNIKFDISSNLKEPRALPGLKNALNGSLLWIAGSTHENEEEMVVGIYKSLSKDFPSMRLLIAPRHLERLDKVRRLIRLQGLESAYLSKLTKISANQIMLLDTMGDLTALYGICDIAFVGGSLVDKGGHNPIEPALFGKTVIFGNHMENFKEIRDIFMREDAAIEVSSLQALEYELRKLLASASERKILGDHAKGLLEKNKGAAFRTFREIQELEDKR